ncbi:MAG: hypothetical protein IBJ00_06790 [Alphaproteobacteria bacterium]|nr:hypothetical protein [Alphaproteobacteria bacterium]
MSKNSLYLSAFLFLISGTYIQATLSTTNPETSTNVPDTSAKGAEALAKCIQDCKIKGVDPNCEVTCTLAQKVTDTNSQIKTDQNSLIPGTIPKD